MNHFSSILAVTWVASLWQGCALALLAAAALRLMPRASAAIRHSILLLVFALTLVLPFLHLQAPSTSSRGAALTIAPALAVAVSLLWSAASLLRASSLIVAWFHLRSVRRSAQPIVLADVEEFTAGTRRARLCSSDQVDTPAVLGFFQPVLLLPTWLVPQLSPDELRHIALHECEHLRRRDDWINLALQLGLVIMPLNPALVWLNRRIGVQRELACDAAVVASTATPLAYAASLTRMAEQRLQRHSLRLALAAWGRQSELALRVHTLLTESTARWSARQSSAALSAAAVLLAIVSTGFVRAPRFVRVAEAVSSSVTVLPPQTSIARTAELSAPAMVQVRYQVKPAAAPHRNLGRPRLVPAVTHVRKPMPATFLRTRFSSDSRIAPEDAFQTNEPAVRFVTTEFVQPYVAVPVANGWLLIEL